MIRKLLFVISILLLFGNHNATAQRATITVTTNADSGAGSLRQAILDSAGGDIITFDPSLQDQTIVLDTTLPTIAHSLTITTDGINVTISGDLRIRSGFKIDEDGVLAIIGLRLVDGLAKQGGAIENRGLLTLVNVTMTNNQTPPNSSTYLGGAIYNLGTISRSSALTIEDSVSYFGGAIFSAGNMTISSSTLRRNTAIVGGSVLQTGGSLLFADVSFYDNSASETGGAIHVASSDAECLFCSLNDNEAAGNGGTFYVEPTSTLVLSSTTVAGGSAENGGTIYNAGITTMRGGLLDDVTVEQNGGVIYNSGTFSAESQASIGGGSTATGNGGGIYNVGVVTLAEMTMQALSAENGGAIYNQLGGQLTVTDSMIFTGSATAGGGIYNRGSAEVSRSTLYGWSATSGAGILNAADGSLLLTNVTLSDNDATKAGGALMNNGGTLEANNITAARNSAGLDGASYDGSYAIIKNSLFADSTGGAECVNTSGAIAIFNTLIEDATCNALAVPANDNRAGDPDLGALADNGGPTLTHALPPTSIAVDGAAQTACDYVDQRGYLRHGLKCDMGAYEISDGVCASYHNGNERISMDSSAVGIAVALLSNAGDTVKVAGNCVGATIGFGGVDHVAWVPVDATIEGGHSALRWGSSADSVNQPTTLDANGEGRVAILNDFATGIFRHVTLQNGFVNGNGGGIYASQTSSLQLDWVTLQNSRASGSMREGGGIYLAGNTTLSITNSVLKGNSAQYGGGVTSQQGITLVSNSTFDDNGSTSSGGGLYSTGGGIVRLLSSSFINHVSGSGSVVHLPNGLLEMENSTISGNSAAASIIRIDSGEIEFINSTIADSTTIGDAPALDITASGSMANMIIASGEGASDCELGAGAPITIFDSLIEDGSCINAGQAGNLDGDPLLLPLADNGGGMLTHALAAASPARDAGNNVDCPSDDQRGEARDDGACDMGAFEADGVPTMVGLTGQEFVVRDSWLVVGVAFVLTLLSSGVVWRQRSLVQ